MNELLGEPWMLSPSVALRPEPFGALAYHFGNRKLTFLKRPDLVAVVRGLDSAPDVRSALVAAGVPASQHSAYAAALEGLAATDMIRPRPLAVVTGEVA
jgi:mycofactocin biosynthesis protein MftB